MPSIFFLAMKQAISLCITVKLKCLCDKSQDFYESHVGSFFTVTAISSKWLITRFVLSHHWLFKIHRINVQFKAKLLTPT